MELGDYSRFKKNIQVARRTQRHMLFKMLGRKRRPIGQELEKWSDYFIRVAREIKVLVKNYKIDIQTLLRAKKLSFAGHVSRFSLEGRETHLLKMLVLWRSNHWWSFQKKQINLGESLFKHSRPGKIARWEAQFQKDWILKFSQGKEN